MTQTRITPGDYLAVNHKASKLFNRIHKLMDKIDPGVPAGDLPEEWAELHDLMRLAHIIATTSSRYATRARDLDTPVPYLPAGGLRDLDEAVKAANPGHALYSGEASGDLPW